MIRQLSRHKHQNGFTIIETMFVLAIAGIMLLIVFDAVPALNRNSRNNQRKQDVNTILEAVSHYELNNSGNVPSCATGSPNPCTGSGSILQNDSLSFYTNIEVIQGIGLLPEDPAVTDDTTVYVYNYAKCDGDTATATGGGYNDIVALYALETGNGTSSECQQL